MTEELTSMAAGAVSVVVTALVRRWVWLEGFWATVLAGAVSGALALALLWLTHQLGPDWEKNLAVGFATATLVYRAWEKKVAVLEGKP